MLNLLLIIYEVWNVNASAQVLAYNDLLDVI